MSHTCPSWTPVQPRSSQSQQPQGVVVAPTSEPAEPTSLVLLAPGLDSAALGVAACTEHDPELFFAETPVGVERAKEICRSCPVQQLCLAAALHRQEPHGVWGGELFVAGQVVARKRPRGRPRKWPVAA